MIELDVKNVCFSYTDDINVLTDINLTLSGMTTGIIGQNGAGKTTLVKLLKGLLKPDSGDILLNGDRVTDKTVAQLSSRIGLVFQNPNEQIFKNKVINEVMFGPLNIGYSDDEAREQAIKALKKVGLEIHTDENPYDLSLSERKMIAIASILAMDTDVIIFDEPTMGQDYAGKQMIKSIIGELKQEGKMVLCILHDMDFAADVFERIIVFNEGQILLEGSAPEVFIEKELLNKAHLEQPQVIQIANQLGMRHMPLNEDELVKLMQSESS